MKKIILFFGKIYYTIKGYFLIKKYEQKIGSIYYCELDNRYYKYLGNKIFKNGNTIIDTGSFVFDVPGKENRFSYYLVGLLNLIEKYEI